MSVYSARTSSCNICFGNFTLKSPSLALKCNHLFHKACITAWQDESGSNYKDNCPICLKVIDMSDYEDTRTTLSVVQASDQRPENEMEYNKTEKDNRLNDWILSTNENLRREEEPEEILEGRWHQCCHTVFSFFQKIFN